MLKYILLTLFFVPLAADPLTLSQAEEKARCQNKQIQAAADLLEKAVQERWEAISKFLPAISFQEVALKHGRAQLAFGPPMTYQTLLSLSQYIFSASLLYDLSLTALQVQTLAIQLEATVNDVLFDLRLAYYKVALDEKIMQTEKERFSLLTASAKETEIKFQAGKATLYERNQARVAAVNARPPYYRAMKALKSDYTALTALLNEPCIEILDREIPLEGFASKLEQPLPDTLEELPSFFTAEEECYWESIAEQKRPAVRLQYTQQLIKEKTLKSRRAAYLPSLSATANYGSNPVQFVANFSSRLFDQPLSWGVMLQLNWQLFDGGGREARIRQARADLSAAGSLYKQSLLDAHAEVQNDIHEMDAALANYISSQSNLALAEQAAVEAKEELDVGRKTLLDYETTLNALTLAKTTFYQSQYDLIGAYYALRHATGIDL